MKLIYGDERDDPNYTSRKLKGIVIFELLMLLPWCIFLVFFPMSVDKIFTQIVLIPFYIYPLLILIFTVISRIEFKKERYERSVNIQWLPITAPFMIMFILASIGSLWKFIA